MSFATISRDARSDVRMKLLIPALLEYRRGPNDFAAQTISKNIAIHDNEPARVSELVYFKLRLGLQGCAECKSVRGSARVESGPARRCDAQGAPGSGPGTCGRQQRWGGWACAKQLQRGRAMPPSLATVQARNLLAFDCVNARLIPPRNESNIICPRE